MKFQKQSLIENQITMGDRAGTIKIMNTGGN